MDGILLEVMRNRFSAIPEEMGATIIKTAYSTNIKDRRDASCALFDVNGDTIAQAEHIPVHSGVLPWGVKGALRDINISELEEGDILMHNDPFVGGTHLPDIILFSPVFYNNKLVAYIGNLAHHIDVGGMVPTSLTAEATEIFQEGIRFPPVKIQKRGFIDKEILSIFLTNIRTPYISEGDLMAQVAAINVGKRRLLEVCQEFSIETVFDAIEALKNYCERRMVHELLKFPYGQFEFSDYVEGDGATTEEPILIKVKLTTGGPKVLIDFTGSNPQVNGSINCVRPMVLACVYYVLRAVTDPTIPPNVGTFKPAEVVTPENTFLNSSYPAATGSGNSITTQRIVDVLLGAFAQAIPDKVCAAASGAMNGIQLGQYDHESREYLVNGETIGGGSGAMFDQDGESGVHTHMTNTRNTPIEVLERILPVTVMKYGLNEDSEGPGQYRGGFGITRVIKFNQNEISCQIISDRVKNKPWGLQNDLFASGSSFTIIRKDGESKQLSSKVRLTMNKGDQLIIETSGGGGYGDPKLRDRKELSSDVKDGLISVERAENIYGLTY